MKRKTAILPPWPFDPFARAQCWEVVVLTQSLATEYYRMVFPRDVAGFQAKAEATLHWRTFILRPGQ